MAKRNGPARSCLASVLLAAAAYAPVHSDALTWTLPASLLALGVQEDDSPEADAEASDWQDQSGEEADASDALDEDAPAADSSASEDEAADPEASVDDSAAESVDESSASEEEATDTLVPAGDAEPASESPEPPSPPATPADAPVPMVPDAPVSRSWADPNDQTRYKVVINHEEQYSIWPASRENPAGWNDAGKSGSKQECLDYIKEAWTDMRPQSLRKRMEEIERERQREGG